jgi:methionyl aminopeptidase
MCIESPQQLQQLMVIGKIVGECLQEMQAAVRAGMTTQELDTIGAAFLAKYSAKSAPQITYGYPGVTCISINDEAAHGIPGKRVLQAGDLVKIDVSAEKNGYFADAALTVGVPPIDKHNQKLIDVALETLHQAIQAAKVGVPVNAIGKAADIYARRNGFQVIRDLPGHGVGLALHEAPSVPSHFEKRARQPLINGLVITVEPHLTTGTNRVKQDADGWTLRTINGKTAANFEHTIVVTPDNAILITGI